MRAATLLLAGFALAAPAVAAAADLRDLCPTRPGLGTPPCIVDQGHLLVELGLGDWTVDSNADARTDTVELGDLLLRYGLTPRDEVQVGWTPYGHVRTRDRATGAVTRDSGTGDVLVAFKHSLVSPAGDGTSIALQSFVTLPTGGSAIGAGDWSAGILAPMNFDLTEKLSFQATPEVDAAVDQDRHGRHASYGGVLGLGYALSKKVSATAELSAFRDDDPAGHTSQLLAGLSAAFQPSDNLQFDAGAAFGLNRATPDTELSIGVSRRF